MGQGLAAALQPPGLPSPLSRPRQAPARQRPSPEAAAGQAGAGLWRLLRGRGAAGLQAGLQLPWCCGARRPLPVAVALT